MFIGRYYHTLEEQGRLSIPKQFRAVTADWVVTRGLDGGLYLFPAEKFATELATIASRTFTKKSDRDFARYMANDAYQLTADSHGRVLLPEYLRSFAQLNKSVVVVGSVNYLEIWDRDNYHQYIQKVEENAVDIAEQVGTNQTKND